MNLKKVISIVLACNILGATVAQADMQSRISVAAKVARKNELNIKIDELETQISKNAIKLGILESMMNDGLRAKFYNSDEGVLVVSAYIGGVAVTWASVYAIARFGYKSNHPGVIAILLGGIGGAFANAPLLYLVKEAHANGHQYAKSLNGKTEDFLSTEYTSLLEAQATLVGAVVQKKDEIKNLNL